MKEKDVRFVRILLRALPEMWFYEIVTGFLVGLLVLPVQKAFRLIATSSGSAITTANIGDLLSWRLAVLIVIGIIQVLLLSVTEISAPIYLCDSIIRQEEKGIFATLKKAFVAVPRFLKPGGILIFLYVLILVPLAGIGISISLTEDFYIPNFIQSVIDSSLVTAIAFRAVIFALMIVGALFIYTFHFILIDNEKPLKAMAGSFSLVKKNWKTFLVDYIKFLLIWGVIYLVFYIIFCVIPFNLLEDLGETLPTGYILGPDQLLEDYTELDEAVYAYRFGALISTYIEKYVFSVFYAVGNSAFFLMLTRQYYRFTREEKESFVLKPKNFRHRILTIVSVIVPFVLLIVSLFGAVFFNELYPYRDPVPVVAHRTGGFLSSENSLEGIDIASEHGCYACETDIQRTADGYYIINHDSDFKRLTGVAKKPGEMTLSEIKELKINDTTGSGDLLEVPTMEELLDRGKEDGIVLYLELKGVSADERMADDVIAAVRERDMTDDVVIISLKLDVLNYIEDNYPEFETGALIFSSLGDASNLKSDMIIMEEEMATDVNIDLVHQAGKKVGVWTVNTYESMYHFRDATVDAIITDDLILAEDVQKELEERTDLVIVEDRTIGN